MKISCNVKQGTSLVKNSSQTVEIKDKTNEKEPYLEQNISNHKLDGSNLDHSIKIFNNLLLTGPIYISQYANKHKATALHKAYWLPCCKFWSHKGFKFMLSTNTIEMKKQVKFLNWDWIQKSQILELSLNTKGQPTGL